MKEGWSGSQARRRNLRGRVTASAVRLGSVARDYRGTIFAVVAVAIVGWFTRPYAVEYAVGVFMGLLVWMVYEAETITRP